MRFVECLQGSPEWMAARAGLITASEFGGICKLVGGLTPQQSIYVDVMRTIEATTSEEDKKKIKKYAIEKAEYKAAPTSTTVARAIAGEKTTDFSDETKRYALDLVHERISKAPYGIPPKAWVLDRGHTMEEIARRKYEVKTGYVATEAGICVDDHGHGYSSDGLVNNDGLIEIKAPIDTVKIDAILRTENLDEYMHQMQGGMWLTGRKWCDFIMYIPSLENIGLDLFVKRVMRDDDFIDAMVQNLVDFAALVHSHESFYRQLKLQSEAENQTSELLAA